MNFQNCNRFLISQRFTALVNRFDIYDDQNELIAFVEQKRFTLREKITVWKSEGKDSVLFTIAAEKVFDIHGKYLVQDEAGETVGYIRKQFAASLIQSTWGVHDLNDNLLYIAKEKNLVIALVRRLGGFVPVVGELLQQLPFGFELLKDGKQVGYHRRQRGLRDKYELTIDEEVGDDKRVLLALGLLLDILQQR